MTFRRPAADAPTLDVLTDNHPEIDPASLFLQITAPREAEPATTWLAHVASPSAS
jgi:hypothetical protein